MHFPGARFYWFAEEHVGKQESFDCRSPEPPPPDVITEHGLRFRVAPGSKHKTGFFLDQRDNRTPLSEFCRGKRVLDLCCNTGGFAVYAKAKGGAAEVVGRRPRRAGHRAGEAEREAERRAGPLRAGRPLRLAARHDPERRAVRRGRARPGEADPRPRDGRSGAPQKYCDMNRLALQVVAPGGLFLTCSCTGLVSEATSSNRSAARRGKRDGRSRSSRSAGPRPTTRSCSTSPRGGTSRPCSAASSNWRTARRKPAEDRPTSAGLPPVRLDEETMTTPTLPRSAGVLLHPTSLPGPFGIGDLGPVAYRWVETLAAMKQIVVANPPARADRGRRLAVPIVLRVRGQRSTCSAPNCWNATGWSPRRSGSSKHFPDDHVDYGRVNPFKTALAPRGLERFPRRQGRAPERRVRGVRRTRSLVAQRLRALHARIRDSLGGSRVARLAEESAAPRPGRAGRGREGSRGRHRDAQVRPVPLRPPVARA